MPHVPVLSLTGAHDDRHAQPLSVLHQNQPSSPQRLLEKKRKQGNYQEVAVLFFSFFFFVIGLYRSCVV
jgi:hypothetical protein